MDTNSVRNILGVALVALVAASTSASALDLVEVAPFFTYRFGGVEIPVGICSPQLPADACLDRVETEDSLAWGLGFAVALRGPWWMELRFSEQVAQAQTELTTSSTEASWDRYLIGFEHRWTGDRRWSPAFAFAGGWTTLSSEVAAPGSGANLTHPTLEVGAGLLVERDERLGVRFEARLSWTALPEELGNDIVQLGLGISFRLKLKS